MTTWLVSGVRTPFARVDGALRHLHALDLSVPVAKAMAAQLPAGDRADLVIWGAVAPNLGWSNIARELVVKSGLDPVDAGRSRRCSRARPAWRRCSRPRAC
jgi:acetyl-CoA C-acetyltransferase